MRKGATKTSGIISIIFYFILFLFSTLILLINLQIKPILDIISQIDILTMIVMIGSYVLYLPVLILLQKLGICSYNSGEELVSSVGGEVDTLSLIVSIFLVVFNLFMLIWGIKEIIISKREDEDFAKCKKSCSFVFIIKFLVFAFFAGILAYSFLSKDYFKVFVEIVNALIQNNNFYQIAFSALSFITLILFLLPVINVCRVAKAVKNGQSNNNHDPAIQNQSNQNINSQEMQEFYNAKPQQTMQANMPPMPGYKPMQNQQMQQPSQIVQNQNLQQSANQSNVAFQTQAQSAPIQQNQQQTQNATAQQNQTQTINNGAQQVNIVPGQDGIPANITEKGLLELQRLERLKNMGALTEANYNAMKQKICLTEISNG